MRILFSNIEKIDFNNVVRLSVKDVEFVENNNFKYIGAQVLEKGENRK